MNYDIYIPSKGRAGQVTTENVLGLPCTIVCPENEVNEYKKHHERVVGCPVNGITKTRNWILENAKRKWLIQIDDDAEGLYYYEKTRKLKVSKGVETDAIFYDMFVMTEQLGTNLWGFNLADDKKFYKDRTPFSLSATLVASMFGMINDGQRFDERLIVKEDYDYSLISLAKYKRILRSNKFTMKVKHLTNSGGCVSYRTREVEQQALNILKKKWGSKIVQAKDTKTFLVVKPPIAGI